jgi:hypothetical protein
MSYRGGQFLLLTRPTSLLFSSSAGLYRSDAVWANDGPDDGRQCLFPSRRAAIAWAEERYKGCDIEISVVNLPANPPRLRGTKSSGPGATRMTICNLSAGDLFQFLYSADVHEVVSAREFRFRKIGAYVDGAFQSRLVPGRTLVDIRRRSVRQPAPRPTTAVAGAQK